MTVVRQLISVLLFILLVLGIACSEPKQLPKNSNQEPVVTSELLALRVLPLKPPSQSLSLSPYSIKQYILQDRSDEGQFFTDLTPIWQALQIDSGERETFKGLSPGYNSWQATILKFSIPTNQTRLAVLKISTDWEDDRRYLIFKQERLTGSREIRWQFIGNIDFYFDRHLDLAHKSYNRIVTDGRNIWFVLRYESNGGTGIFSISEAWYRIGEKVTRVLDYPIYGYFSNDYITNRVYNSRIVNQHRVGDAYTVKLLFSAKYIGFRKRQIATYEWNKKLGSFVLDASESAISEEEIEEVYGGGVIRDDRFLSYYYPELRWIAGKGNTKQKEWLGEAIKRMPDSEQRSALEEQLKKRNPNYKDGGV